jgi:hypothetical protein
MFTGCTRKKFQTMEIANQAAWNAVKDKIKEVESSVTDSDLAFFPGEEDELYDHLARKLRKNKNDIKAWIESLESTSSIAG